MGRKLVIRLPSLPAEVGRSKGLAVCYPQGDMVILKFIRMMFILYYFIAAFLLAWALSLILERHTRENKKQLSKQEIKEALRRSRR